MTTYCSIEFIHIFDFHIRIENCERECRKVREYWSWYIN